MLHGAGAFRDALTEKLVLADRFADGLDGLIAAGAPIEIVARPELSLVAFRLARQVGEPLSNCNARNAAFLRAINAKNRVHLSSTLLATPEGDAFTLRVCVLSFRSHARHVEWCLEDIAAATTET
jgi:aromatic-L-amino-acid decarboxylase